MNASIRLLAADEVAAADHIFRLAFGTWLELPEPAKFIADVTYIPHRWQANPQTVFAAFIDGKLIGSNVVVDWGSFGYIGPLSVHPDYWDQGIGQSLIQAGLDYFHQKQTQLIGLFTFVKSPKHHGLYQKFGFRLRFLTVIMAKEVHSQKTLAPENRFSQINEALRAICLTASRQLTDSIYAGLDVSSEIQSVQAQGLGETILLWDEGELVGFAVCHVGAGTEAGSDTCLIKFAVASSGANASQAFAQLLDLCEGLTTTVGMLRLVAGVNTAREQAYLKMLERGFRTQVIGVAMNKPNQAGYNLPEVFIVDDWR